MKTRFRGKIVHALDHKKRVAPPKGFKQTLTPEDENTFTMTLGFDGCLFLYTKTGYALLEEELEKLSMWDKNARIAERLLSEYTYDVPVDSQGRIRIPSELLERVPLDKEVMFLGVKGRVEVWDPKAYEKYKAKTKLSLEEVAQKLFPGWGSHAQKR
jgi:MraZ protein